MKRFLFMAFLILNLFSVSAFEVNPPIVKSGVRGEDSVVQPMSIFNDGKTGNFAIEIFSERDFIDSQVEEIELEGGNGAGFELILRVPNHENGVYLGRMEVREGEETNIVPIVFEQESEEVDFDAIIQIPSAYSSVLPDEEFVAQVQVHSLTFLDDSVELEFFIENFYGEIIAHETQEISFENKIELTKSFKIPADVREGDYVFYVHARSGESFATSSAFFTIERQVQLSPEKDSKGYLVFLIIFFLAGSFLVFNFLWKRKLMSVAKGWKGRISTGKLTDSRKEVARLMYELTLLENAYAKKYIKKSSYEKGRKEISLRIRSLKKRL